MNRRRKKKLAKLLNQSVFQVPPPPTVQPAPPLPPGAALNSLLSQGVISRNAAVAGNHGSFAHGYVYQPNAVSISGLTQGQSYCNWCGGPCIQDNHTPATPEEIEDAVKGLQATAKQLTNGPYEKLDIEGVCPDVTETLRVGAFLVDSLLRAMLDHEDTLSWKNEFSVSILSKLQSEWLPLARKRLNLE